AVSVGHSAAFGSMSVLAGGTVSNAVIDGGVLTIGSGATASGSVDFLAGGGNFLIVGAAMPGVTISGFAAGDRLDLASVIYDGTGTVSLLSGNVLQVTDNGNYDLQLDQNQNFNGQTFYLLSDLSGGTSVEVSGGASIVVSGGETLTISGGQSSGAIIVESGGTFNSASVLSGGTVELVGGAQPGNMALSAGATIELLSGFLGSGFTLGTGVTADIAAGGSGLSATIFGSAVILSGGTAIDTVVGAGGVLELLSGSINSSATVSSGGTLEFFGSVTQFTGVKNVLLSGATV